jgi:1-acyl-sn-glycerol-3-phosphate acyltransferase
MTATLVCAARSALFTLIFYIGSVLWVSTAAIAGCVDQKYLLRVARSWAFMHRWACRWILGQKIVFDGALPDEPVLYVFKHESMFETIDVLCQLQAPAVAAKQELLDIPGWGWIARQHGVIGLEREAGAKALRHLQKQALARVAEGRPVVLFPEGTRVPHGTIAPLKAGFAALYQLLKLPVIPVAIDSGRLSPRGKFLKRAGTITYKVGDRIPAGLPRQEAEDRAIAAMNALNPAAHRAA